MLFRAVHELFGIHDQVISSAARLVENVVRVTKGSLARLSRFSFEMRPCRLSLVHGCFGCALGLLSNLGGNALRFDSNRLGVTLGLDPQLLGTEKRTTQRVGLLAEIIVLRLKSLQATLCAFKAFE